jgi:hypothetical protein
MVQTFPNSLTTALQNPQIADPSGTTVAATNVASAEFIVPFIAQMSADASGQVGVLQQLTVTMTQIDQKLNVVLDEADAIALLKSFVVTDTDAGAPGSKTATADVDMANQAGFVAALAKAISADESTHTSDSFVVDGMFKYGPYGYLLRESRQDTLDMLGYDSLANLLEASDLLTFDIALDASGGATNMYNAMNTGSAQYRRALLKQLTEARVESYLQDASAQGHSGATAEAVAQLNFLPMWAGDKLVFVFDVTVGELSTAQKPVDAPWSIPSNGAKISRIVNDGNGALSAGSAGDSAMAGGQVATSFGTTSAFGVENLVFTAATKRRIALYVQLAGTGTGVTASGSAFPYTRSDDTVSLA